MINYESHHHQVVHTFRNIFGAGGNNSGALLGFSPSIPGKERKSYTGTSREMYCTSTAVQYRVSVGQIKGKTCGKTVLRLKARL